MTGKYIYGISLVILKVERSKSWQYLFLTNTNNTSFWWDFDWIIRLWHCFGYTMSGSRSKVIKSKRRKCYFSKKASSNKQMFYVIYLIILMIKGHLQVSNVNFTWGKIWLKLRTSIIHIFRVKNIRPKQPKMENPFMFSLSLLWYNVIVKVKTAISRLNQRKYYSNKQKQQPM